MKRSPDAQRLLAQYRRSIQPTEAQLDDVRARLQQPPARRRGPLVIGLVFAGAAAVLLVRWVARSETATAVPQDPSTQAPHESAPPSTGGRWDGPPPRSHRAPVSTPRPPDGSNEAPPPSARRPPTQARPVQEPPVPPPSLQLAAEAELIRKAEAQLRTSALGEALETLGTHARSFPDGALTTERRALRAIALCRSGKRAQGRGEAAALRDDPASHPYRARIAQACE